MKSTEIMAKNCGCAIEHEEEKKLLIIVLVINALMFFVEFAAGWLAQSSALLADSLDMLADASVYAISFYAVGKAKILRANAALATGSLQLLLGVGILLDVVRKIWLGAMPEPSTMGIIGLIALIANVTCFILLWRHRNSEINLRASWICSRNDMFANFGVIVAGGLVIFTGTPYPDWVVGALIAALIIHSALGIIRSAFKSRKALHQGDIEHST